MHHEAIVWPLVNRAVFIVHVIFRGGVTDASKIANVVAPHVDTDLSKTA